MMAANELMIPVQKVFELEVKHFSPVNEITFIVANLSKTDLILCVCVSSRLLLPQHHNL